MGKYVPKYPRGRCHHVFKRNHPRRGICAGDQCIFYGRKDKDNEFRCSGHRFKTYVLRKAKESIMKKKESEKIAIKKLETIKNKQREAEKLLIKLETVCYNSN